MIDVNQPKTLWAIFQAHYGHIDWGMKLFLPTHGPHAMPSVSRRACPGQERSNLPFRWKWLLLLNGNLSAFQLRSWEYLIRYEPVLKKEADIQENLDRLEDDWDCFPLRNNLQNRIHVAKVLQRKSLNHQ